MSKSCQKLQYSDFQSQFSMSKIIQIFLNFVFIEKYHFRSTFFVIHTFLKTSIFKSLYFLKWHFTQLTARLQNFLRGRLLLLGLKENLVECATVCDSVRLKWGHTKARGSWMTFFLSFFLGWRKMKKTRISSWKSTQGTGYSYIQPRLFLYPWLIENALLATYRELSEWAHSIRIWNFWLIFQEGLNCVKLF